MSNIITCILVIIALVIIIASVYMLHTIGIIVAIVINMLGDGNESERSA